MIKAIFIDFYGTVVFEDGEVIERVVQEIIRNRKDNSGNTKDKSAIGGYWWKEFQTAFTNAYGDTFETQRKLEYQSLAKTIEYFGSTADAVALSEEMFAYWRKPPIFPESKEFFEKCPVPIYVVSNIDRADIMAAIAYHGLKPAGVFTSEDALVYKPRKELFEYALKLTGLQPEDVIHIGDSLSSDVKGASSLGIDTIWVNRGNRPVPEGVCAVGNLLEIFETEYFK